MKVAHSHFAGLAAVLLAAMLLSAWPLGPAMAQQVQSQDGLQLAMAPKPAKGKGDKCVAPTDWMRRNHMSVLMHQRDKTVHAGVRAGPFDLKGCISCHAVKGDDGRAVTVKDPRHFCRTCHDYAAVKVDCFECHASRPEQERHGSLVGDSRDVAALSEYLKGKAP